MKNIKKLSIIIIALVFTFSLMACTKSETKKEEVKGIKITDSYNREVSLDKVPQRVVTLSPGATETIFALKKESVLVGRSDYDDYPAEVSKIEKVGGLENPNIEKITELKPDLVIAGAHFSKEVLKKLEDLGIKVAVLYGEDNFDGAYKNILDTAEVLGVKNDGQKIVDGMKKKVSQVEEKIKDSKKVKLYYVVDFGKQDFTAGGDTFVGQLIEKAGGDNIAKDVKGWNYSFEKIVENNPDVIILSDKYDAKKRFIQADRYKDLSAVKANKVFEIDDNMLVRQGPRQADGLEALAKILHPEAF
ncbi:ABC transporter substrate-binding protein [Clostridium folliculivorans]|uniref:ABC transporter substrate-binding protein n=1 Tax=Clostridium folliculivorans TaxID=2886038 RepID=A0A9W5Y535_9CLOT|nr:ABC transporter substrate-binding protein [Clostridium folliculivorans]GKU26749.1 ABC transporter substrate-binding protein [Clostridium folliculivorans]GKU31343.1 ABC transporter substrate-binding protein [Clostridium folliculivorans]